MANRKKKISVVAVDLFCGIGGLTHGLKKSGIEVVAGIDVDERCGFAFEKNNKALFINKSIKDVSSREIVKLYPNDCVKVLVGCAPCQPFSKHTQKAKDREKKGRLGTSLSFLGFDKKNRSL
ncbi:DNA cytosine methyltransferase [Candidatus Omnitrophota bacterium]